MPKATPIAVNSWIAVVPWSFCALPDTSLMVAAGAEAVDEAWRISMSVADMMRELTRPNQMDWEVATSKAKNMYGVRVEMDKK
jgi:hypothetical protein